jgi:hypothetical protein
MDLVLYAGFIHHYYVVFWRCGDHVGEDLQAEVLFAKTEGGSVRLTCRKWGLPNVTFDE